MVQQWKEKLWVKTEMRFSGGLILYLVLYFPFEVMSRTV